MTASPTHPAAVCNDDCILRPGNTNCGGCGMSIALTMLGRAMAGEKKTFVIPACCGIVTAGAYPTTSYAVPTIAATFGSAPAFGSGVAAVRDINNEPYHVVCWAGDGGTYDIGVASLSASAERDDNLIYFCYDNEIYGNTGGQRSSATPVGARTSTTPAGKHEPKKDIVAIMAAHRIPYAATLSIAHPADFDRKIRTALSTKGFRFLLIHAPCPTGWKSEPAESVELVRLAVRSGLFLLYEVFDGVKYHVNAEPDGTDPAKYYERQRRFPAGEIDLDAVRRAAEANWQQLQRLVRTNPDEAA